MSKSKKEYNIIPVDSLPVVQRKELGKIYTDILNEIQDRPEGYYKIDIPNRNIKTVYFVLSRRIKLMKAEDKLKLNVRKDVLYIHKIS